MEAYKRMSIYRLVKEHRAISLQSYFILLKDYANLQGSKDVANGVTFQRKKEHKSYTLYQKYKRANQADLPTRLSISYTKDLELYHH
jgi:hypothetical protein